MGGFGDAIKYLYDKFILRDVLSFVTPGAIVVLTAFVLLKEPSLYEFVRYSRELHWLLYIPLFGIFFLVGFAVQCLGEMFGFVRFSPYYEKSWGKRWSIFLCGYDKNYEAPEQSNMWWWQAHKEWDKFFYAIRPTKYNEGIQQGHERLVVFKQMCANSFVAITIASILIVVETFLPEQKFTLTLLGRNFTMLKVVIFILTVLFLASLFWGHRVYMLLQYTREKIFKSEYQRRRRFKHYSDYDC